MEWFESLALLLGSITVLLAIGVAGAAIGRAGWWEGVFGGGGGAV